MVTRSKEHHTLQKKWLTWCLAIWPNCFNNTTFYSNMTINYLKSGKICWLTHTIFTSADIILVVRIMISMPFWIDRIMHYTLRNIWWLITQLRQAYDAPTPDIEMLLGHKSCKFLQRKYSQLQPGAGGDE
jgi:hypothetical protein